MTASAVARPVSLSMKSKAPRGSLRKPFPPAFAKTRARMEQDQRGAAVRPDSGQCWITMMQTAGPCSGKPLRSAYDGLERGGAFEKCFEFASRLKALISSGMRAVREPHGVRKRMVFHDAGFSCSRTVPAFVVMPASGAGENLIPRFFRVGRLEVHVPKGRCPIHGEVGKSVGRNLRPTGTSSVRLRFRRKSVSVRSIFEWTAAAFQVGSCRNREVEIGRAARVVIGGGVGGSVDLAREHRTAAEIAEIGERIEDRLPPGGAAGFRQDRRDGVDELRQAGGLDAIGVVQKRDAGAAEGERVLRSSRLPRGSAGRPASPPSCGREGGVGACGTRRSTRRSSA